jgi:hypothetical protein
MFSKPTAECFETTLSKQWITHPSVAMIEGTIKFGGNGS